MARARGGGRSDPGYHRRKGVPGCAAPRVSSAQARPGVWLSHRSGAGSGPGWEYIVPQVSRSGMRKLRYSLLERSKTPFRSTSEPFRCLEDKLSLSYYTSDGMDSKSQSHTQSNQKVPYHPGQNTPGITKRGQARGAAHPGYHDSGATSTSVARIVGKLGVAEELVA